MCVRASCVLYVSYRYATQLYCSPRLSNPLVRVAADDARPSTTLPVRVVRSSSVEVCDLMSRCVCVCEYIYVCVFVRVSGCCVLKHRCWSMGSLARTKVVEVVIVSSYTSCQGLWEGI